MKQLDSCPLHHKSVLCPLDVSKMNNRIYIPKGCVSSPHKPDSNPDKVMSLSVEAILTLIGLFLNLPPSAVSFLEAVQV